MGGSKDLRGSKISFDNQQTQTVKQDMVEKDKGIFRMERKRKQLRLACFEHIQGDIVKKKANILRTCTFVERYMSSTSRRIYDASRVWIVVKN